MSSNKKTNNFLKECMADALINLMQTKEYAKITINEIAGLAGVNRSTWFRNFAGKSEALTFKLVQLWYRQTDDCAVNGQRQYSTDNAGDFFRFNYEERRLVDLMIKSGLQSAIYEAFYEIMMPQFASDIDEGYETRFYSYGLFGLLGEWNKRNYKESPEEMVEIFNKIMEKAPSV